MTKSHGRTTRRAALPLLALWVLVYMGARLLLETQFVAAPSARLGVSLLPVPMFAAFLWTFVQAMRGADELERRIQLEALAIAFPLGLLLLTSLGLVERAVTLSPQDWSYNHVWPMFALLYIVGMATARRRYA